MVFSELQLIPVEHQLPLQAADRLLKDDWTFVAKKKWPKVQKNPRLDGLDRAYAAKSWSRWHHSEGRDSEERDREGLEAAEHEAESADCLGRCVLCYLRGWRLRGRWLDRVLLSMQHASTLELLWHRNHSRDWLDLQQLSNVRILERPDGEMLPLSKARWCHEAHQCFFQLREVLWLENQEPDEEKLKAR